MISFVATATGLKNWFRLYGIFSFSLEEFNGLVERLSNSTFRPYNISPFKKLFKWTLLDVTLKLLTRLGYCSF